MTDVTQLLLKHGISTAAIVDDAFDEAPRADDLDVDSWNTFWDDIASYEDAISKIYPAYADTTREELQGSDKFVSSLWEHRDALPKEVRASFFEDYEQKSRRENEWLNKLAGSLRQLGLECTTFGREFADGARDADVVFIDLFLGFWESDLDMGQAIDGIRDLVRSRESTPPLVILMSRSQRLAEKRNEFRDKAGLLGSTFRVVSKAELDEKENMLEKMLARLASHYDDSKRVARFVYAWDNGLQDARKRFIQVLRRLDLSDLAQVQALLLDFEGQQLGEYLLDVADRVLQHEIEADTGTIAAAQGLNKIDLRKYPAPHLAGSPDLQKLVHRMVFQHVERLKLSRNEEVPQIQFGDLLRCKDQNTGTATDDVLLVMTPACDLVRCKGTESVLLLLGLLKPLGASDWSYGSHGPSVAKTPIFEAPDGSRYWIKWNLKARETILLKALWERLDKKEGYERVGRIREICALEIQQRMLADMGRIGQPANPPATFPVSIELYVVSSDASARAVNIPELTEAACFVGRGEHPGRVDHLVLSETACDAFQDKIQTLSPDEVHALAQPSLAAMKADLGFFERFEQGLINVPVKDNKLEPQKGKGDLIYMHFVRNEWVKESEPVAGNHRNAPLIMKICDILPT